MPRANPSLDTFKHANAYPLGDGLVDKWSDFLEAAQDGKISVMYESVPYKRDKD